MNIFDAYVTLNVSPANTDDEIKGWHRSLSRRYHPDRDTGDSAKFHDVQQAYQLIKDQRARRNLAIRLSGLGDECPTCHGKGYRKKGKGFVKVGVSPCRDCRSTGYIER